MAPRTGREGRRGEGGGGGRERGGEARRWAGADATPGVAAPGGGGQVTQVRGGGASRRLDAQVGSRPTWGGASGRVDGVEGPPNDARNVDGGSLWPPRRAHAGRQSTCAPPQSRRGSRQAPTSRVDTFQGGGLTSVPTGGGVTHAVLARARHDTPPLSEFTLTPRHNSGSGTRGTEARAPRTPTSRARPQFRVIMAR